MSLLTVIITLVVVGVILWLINTLIPMQGTIKALLNLVIIIVVVVWLLRVFHLMPLIASFKVGN